MNEKFNKNTKVEQLTKVVLSHGEEKDLIVKDPLIGPMLYYMHVTGASIAPEQSCAFVKHRNLWTSVHLICEKTYVQEIQEPSGVQQD